MLPSCPAPVRNTNSFYEMPSAQQAGEVLFVPAGTVHEVRNVGSGNAAELGTYFVEKGKPLLVNR